MDDLIDDIREEMDTAAHISDAISTPLDSGMQSDDDLLAELDALVEEETESKLTDVPAALPAKPGKVAADAAAEEPLPDLPAVPTSKPVPPSSVAVSERAS